MNASLTISLNEYNELLAQRDRALADLAEAQALASLVKLGDPVGAIAKMATFSRDCLTLARFAVANCEPSLFKGWPYEELRRVADGLEQLPDYTLSDRDMAIDLKHFADDCETYEVRRRNAPKPTKFTQEEINAERDRLAQDPVGAAVLAKMDGSSV